MVDDSVLSLQYVNSPTLDGLIVPPLSRRGQIVLTALV